MNQSKIIIYQVLPRLFGNSNNHCVNSGNITDNGCGKMADFTPLALNEIKKLGVTHIWYTGVIEHTTQTDYRRYNICPDHPAVVKGKAGSPYAIKDYYDIDPDLAVCVPERMREFEELLKRTHAAGLQVILDFVPNHVARQYHSDQLPKGVKNLGEDDDDNVVFSPYNNFYYIPQVEFRGQFDLRSTADEPYKEYPAKVTGNNRFDATPNKNDWYETVKLNYGVDYSNGGYCCFSPTPDTWLKMRDILLFWAAKGVDGFRCDMAEMVPVEFWEWVIPQIKIRYNSLFIAEVYNPKEYRDYLFRGKFDYLYDKVGLYDTLRNVACGYDSANAITRSWQALNGIESRMLNFMENHDEQRIASNFFAGTARRGIPAMIVSACMNTNPLMIYFGQELGEPGMDSEGFSGRDGRTSIFDYWSVDSIRRWRNNGKFDNKQLTPEQQLLRTFYGNLLNVCLQEKAISQGLFFDLMYANQNGWRFNEHKQYAFLRKCANEVLLIVVNFDVTPVNVAINIPSHAFDYLQMPQLESVMARELLAGIDVPLTLLPYKATEVTLNGYSGKILKIVL